MSKGQEEAMKARFDQIEREIMEGQHTAASVFTQMRTAALCIGQAARQQAPAEQEPSEWPKLDRPALVGSTRFNKGVSSRLVVECAQRRYEFEVTPEKEAKRITESRALLDNFLAQAAPQPEQSGLVDTLLAEFPLLGDEGLDPTKHHCEWAMQQDRKRLHNILTALSAQGEGHE